MPADSTLERLVTAQLGPEGAGEVLSTLQISPALCEPGPGVSRAVFAMALNAVLFADLLARAPTGAAYVADVRAQGGRVCFDHGAVRTVILPGRFTGVLPPGAAAMARILKPLGYERAGVYPLDQLRMTGYAYAHRDHASDIPQVFVSELHVDRLPQDAQAAAVRTFETSREPLGLPARDALRCLAVQGRCSMSMALAALPEIASAFGRSHDLPTFEDYEALKACSLEAAWIATEGQTFNHATDRVQDIEAVACAQRALGRPIKDVVEVSRTGSVRQTAFRADPVERDLPSARGSRRVSVPGSFYEFIARDLVKSADGAVLDLSFDSNSAQGIFQMTSAA